MEFYEAKAYSNLLKKKKTENLFKNDSKLNNQINKEKTIDPVEKIINDQQNLSINKSKKSNLLNFFKKFKKNNNNNNNNNNNLNNNLNNNIIIEKDQFIQNNYEKEIPSLI
ncbi:hypothetical protein RB653_008691 [Dictyostelium firmibasis]|uniref:Uncharacterized protein n=1 Tax=Dictyostelium firmibasis TaxID=79012 RepID=A0AAN7TT54_9MYCE